MIDRIVQLAKQQAERENTVIEKLEIYASYLDCGYTAYITLGNTKVYFVTPYGMLEYIPECMQIYDKHDRKEVSKCYQTNFSSNTQ